MLSVTGNDRLVSSVTGNDRLVSSVAAERGKHKKGLIMKNTTCSLQKKIV